MNRILKSKWFTLVGSVTLLAGIAFVAVQFPALRSKHNERTRIDQELERLRGIQADLDQHQNYYQSEAYAQLQARAKLHYQNPGERVVYVYRSDPPPSEAAILDNPRSHLQQWWEYLISRD